MFSAFILLYIYIYIWNSFGIIIYYYLFTHLVEFNKWEQWISRVCFNLILPTLSEQGYVIRWYEHNITSFSKFSKPFLLCLKQDKLKKQQLGSVNWKYFTFLRSEWNLLPLPVKAKKKCWSTHLVSLLLWVICWSSPF